MNVWLLILLINTSNCLKNDTTDMLISFITYEDRPTSVLMPNPCWKSYELKSLAKKLTPVGISLACSLQPNRPEHHLHQILIIADLACPEINSFLIKVNDEGYFKSPHRWLLLDEEEAEPEIFDHITMLVDSDVVIARRKGQEVHFIEAYKVWENKEVIYNTRFIWKPQPLYFNYLNHNSSKNYTLNQNITNVNEISKESATMTWSKYGLIEDFRKTKVISIRRMDLRRHVLTMACVIIDSNETRTHMDDRLYLNQDSMTKISYAAVKICFEMLNASENLIFTNTWGYKDNNGNWQGMVDLLLKKKADLGMLAIFTQARMEVVDYIAMVGYTRFRFIFRDPPLAYMSNIYTLPFTGTVWLMSLICVVSCSVFIFITSKWEHTMGTHPSQLDGTWADVLILAISAVLQKGCTLEPKYAAGRCVTFFLFLTLTVLYSAYSANIVVLLRAPSSSVKSLSDLLYSPMEIGASDFEYNRYFLKKLNEPLRKEIYEKKIAPKGKSPNFFELEKGIEKIRKGLFALHIEINPGYYLIQRKFQEHEKCDLVELDYLNEIDPWVPGQKRSPFKEMFKINFMKFRESGIQACIHHRLTVSKPKCSGTLNTFSSVGISDMLPALLGTLHGVLAAPVVLLLEIAYKRLFVVSSVGISDMLPALLGTLHGVLAAPVVLLLEIAYKRLMNIRRLRKITQKKKFQRNIIKAWNTK